MRTMILALCALFTPPAEGAPTAEEGFVTTPDGVHLFYRSIGEGDGTVLLPGSVYLFDDFKRLADGRRLIAYDLRNRGQSDSVADRAKLERGIHQDADDMETMRKHFGVNRIAVIGHSYVGLVAALYGMNHPQHVERIVQIGPPSPIFGKTYPAPADAKALFGEAFAKIGALQKQELDPQTLCERSWDALRPIYVADRKDVSKLASWGRCDLPNERGALQHFNANILPTMKSLSLTKEQLAKASMPVLIVHGTIDRNTPYDGAKDWAAMLPNARLVTIDHAAHAPWVEAPDKVFGAIDQFLKGE